MNVRRLRKLARHMEPMESASGCSAERWARADETSLWVNMGCWYERGSCGTVGCIAGHAVALFAPDEVDDVNREGSLAPHAAKLLGIIPDTESYYYRARDVDVGEETRRRVEVAKALFFPMGVTVWDGADCAAVLRAVADSPEDIAHHDVLDVWDRRAVL